MLWMNFQNSSDRNTDVCKGLVSPSIYVFLNNFSQGDLKHYLALPLGRITFESWLDQIANAVGYSRDFCSICMGFFEEYSWTIVESKGNLISI